MGSDWDSRVVDMVMTDRVEVVSEVAVVVELESQPGEVWQIQIGTKVDLFIYLCNSGLYAAPSHQDAIRRRLSSLLVEHSHPVSVKLHTAKKEKSVRPPRQRPSDFIRSYPATRSTLVDSSSFVLFVPCHGGTQTEDGETSNTSP